MSSGKKTVFKWPRIRTVTQYNQAFYLDDYTGELIPRRVGFPKKSRTGQLKIRGAFGDVNTALMFLMDRVKDGQITAEESKTLSDEFCTYYGIPDPKNVAAPAVTAHDLAIFGGKATPSHYHSTYKAYPLRDEQYILASKEKMDADIDRATRTARTSKWILRENGKNIAASSESTLLAHLKKQADGKDDKIFYLAYAPGKGIAIAAESTGTLKGVKSFVRSGDASALDDDVILLHKRKQASSKDGKKQEPEKKKKKKAKEQEEEEEQPRAKKAKKARGPKKAPKEVVMTDA